MGAIADLWKSERGLLAVLLVIGATVLTALSQMTIQQWQDYTLWIFGLYAGSKTVTGAVALFKGGTAEPEAAPAPTPAPASVPAPAPDPTPTPAEPPK
jgi:hypothetical protein